MKILHATAAPLLLCLALLAPPRAGAAEPTDCDRSGSKITASPDGRLQASVQEEVCSFGKHAGAAITVVVSPPGAPEKAERAASIAVPGSREEWPVALWRGPKELQVWVPNLAHVLEVEPAVGDVAVSLHYCDDNPGDRQRVADYRTAFEQWKRDTTAWVQKRKADPASAGPRPERPQEPRVPVGRCDAGALQ